MTRLGYEGLRFRAEHDRLADTLPPASVPGRGKRTAGQRYLTSGWRSFWRISPNTAAAFHKERLWGDHGEGADGAPQLADAGWLPRPSW
jgi:hypothetical protein